MAVLATARTQSAADHRPVAEFQVVEWLGTYLTPEMRAVEYG